MITLVTGPLVPSSPTYEVPKDTPLETIIDFIRSSAAIPCKISYMGRLIVLRTRADADYLYIGMELARDCLARK